MPERSELETLFLANLPLMERILTLLARRHRLTPDAADEFSAWAKMRLVENDYAILARFRGDSSLPTYLSVVLATLFREHRVREWGRWRPSAVAKRGGELLIRLETLTRRDGLSLPEAAETLRSRGITQLSDSELADLSRQLPDRIPLRPVVAGELPTDAPSLERADGLLETEEAAAEKQAVKRALTVAVNDLTDEDRLVVRMRFVHEMSVADIARALAVPQKPLYRQLERALSRLRRTLEQKGVSRDYVRSLTMG